MSWHLIYNKLKILIDPRYFADRSMIEEQVNFVNMLLDYTDKTDPALCEVEFSYPEFIEERLAIRRIFNTLDTKIIRTKQPKKIIEFFTETLIADPKSRKIQNELLSLAVENKIPFILSNVDLSRKEELDLISQYNISILKRTALEAKLKAFLQGFFNYYKFDLLQGVDSADIAHAMSDPLHKKLYAFENDIKMMSFSNETKERIRSFVHNRYIDILITIEKISFYKIQQQISDIERNVLANKNPQFHGVIRYYLNYYLLLLWGYVDHMCLIINDIFELGYNEEKSSDRRKIGFRNFPDKQEYLQKIKDIDLNLYNFIQTKDFQEWLNVLGQLRHKNAHKEMISPSPLLRPTPESEIADEEIDAIIYKDKPPIKEDIASLLPPAAIEYQKVLDRHHYRVSKMEKVFDHVAIVKEGFLDPIARINIDMKNFNKLTELFLIATQKLNREIL